MSRLLVIQLGLSVAAALAAAVASIMSGAGVLAAMAAYSLVGSATLVTLATAVACMPRKLLAHGRAAAPAKPERAYA